MTMEAAVIQAFMHAKSEVEERRELVREMVDDATDCIKALRQPIYGLVHVTDDQAEERARNLVGRWILKYRIERQEP